MSRKHILLWFRNDLRLRDNEALDWSIKNGQKLTPLYVFDPRQLTALTHNFEFIKCGPFRAKLLLEAVKDLKTSFQDRGGDLITSRGHPEEIIQSIYEKYPFECLTFSKEVTSEEIRTEKILEKFCLEKGIEFRPFWSSTLYHVEDLPFETLPTTFTEFRKLVEDKVIVRECFQTPTHFEHVQIDLINAFNEQLTTLPQGPRDGNSCFPFEGGERSGESRLASYLSSNAIATYKETRNGMIGTEYSTKFAPFLSLGSLSPRVILSSVKNYEKRTKKNDSTYWVYFELLWRDFFRFLCRQEGNKVFHIQGVNGTTPQHPWSTNQTLFRAWADGKTGVPFVDANMRELSGTGWMSNRGRQNVASFLVKDLALDWRMGAEWFESLLLDYDVCSNYGNWNYIAGVGNDPRQGRKFNVVKQGMDYDPDADYIKTWLPELSSLPPAKAHMPWKYHLALDYPKPIVMAKEWDKQFHRVNTNRKNGGNFYFKRS